MESKMDLAEKIEHSSFGPWLLVSSDSNAYRAIQSEWPKVIGTGSKFDIDFWIDRASTVCVAEIRVVDDGWRFRTKRNPNPGMPVRV
jgi:hypothetical protein